jgi:1-acyl-sn-glycerol-3-phosphate acyltransferase
VSDQENLSGGGENKAPTQDPATPPSTRVKFTYRGEGTDIIQVIEWDIGRVFFQFIAVLFFRARIFGRNNIPAKGPALLVTNHQSMLDPWLIGIALHRQIHFMARETLFKGGFWQYALERTNAFPIRRGRADATAIRDAVERLKKGYLVNIFPEATRTTDGTIGPIAAGVAIIVHRAHVPVIPVVIDGAFEIWPRGRKFPRLGKLRLRYGEPIPYAQLENLSADEISVRIRTEMIQLQKRLNSPHTAASQRRFASDLAAGNVRLVVSRELSA